MCEGSCFLHPWMWMQLISLLTVCADVGRTMVRAEVIGQHDTRFFKASSGSSVSLLMMADDS